MSKQLTAPVEGVEKKNQPAAHFRAAIPNVSEEVSILLPHAACHPHGVLESFKRSPIYPAGKSHCSRLILGADGRVSRRRKLVSYARVDQRGAVHEAAHAMVASALGRRVYNVNYEAGVWIACGIMVEGQVGSVSRDDFLAFDLDGEADADDVIEGCAICYAGCVAEARYAHVSLPYCMNSSGGHDIAGIRRCLKKGARSFGGKEQQEALAMARRITAKYQDVIYGIAEVLLARHSLDDADFLEILERLDVSTGGDEEEHRRRDLKEEEKLAAWEIAEGASSRSVKP